MKTLQVTGVHCDACKTLITMELEEANLSSSIDEIEQDGENNGVISLKESTSDETINKIKEIINQMDGYSVA